MKMLEITALLAINLFYSWRLALTTVDPDWAYFNLWSFTGARYGRDFVDCKTPAIHVWYLLLTKVMGRDVFRVKFANHFILGAVGLAVFAGTGNFWAALLYTVMINSGWLLAFHGNVSQLPAALITLAFLSDGWIHFVLWTLAVLVEPKLVLSFFALFPNGATLLLFVGMAVYLLLYQQEWFKLVWESSVTLPARIGIGRKGLYDWFPWYTSTGLLYVLPWLVFGWQARPDILYWIPLAIYLVLIAAGRAVRQNHFIPVVPWLVMAGLSPYLCGLIVAVDFITAGAYFGKLWARFYGALDTLNTEAQKAGEYLREQSGTVYVNGLHSAIYIHARKPPQFGFVEQIEIRENAHERREKMIAGWKQAPPDWVVVGMAPGVSFKPVGYKKVTEFGDHAIFKKVRVNHV